MKNPFSSCLKSKDPLIANQVEIATDSAIYGLAELTKKLTDLLEVINSKSLNINPVIIKACTDTLKAKIDELAIKLDSAVGNEHLLGKTETVRLEEDIQMVAGDMHDAALVPAT